MKHAAHKSQRGFTLMELAIVLGVIAIIIGGIWWSVGVAREYMKRQQALEEVALVVNNVQAFYGSQVGLVASGIAVISGSLANQGTIPSYMVRTAGCTNTPALCADNPWGQAADIADGTFRVCDWTLGGQTVCNLGAGVGTVQFFSIEEVGLDNGSCIALVAKISGASGPPGLVDVSINGTMIVANGGTLPVQDSAPATPGFGTGLCSAGPGANTVDFIYRLRAPN